MDMKTPEDMKDVNFFERAKNSFKRVCAVVGATAVSTGLFSSCDPSTAQLKIYHSTNQDCLQDTKDVDGSLRIVDSNTHNNASYTSDLMNKTGATIGVFQESTANKMQGIVDRVACSTGYFAMGDWPVSWQDGGMGNLIIAKDIQPETDMKQFYGSVDFVDLFKGMFTANKKRITDSYNERRSALTSKFNIRINGVDTPLKIMGLHLSGEQNAEEVVQYINQEMSDGESLDIIFGDWNRLPEEVRKIMLKAKGVWFTPDMGPTSSANTQIDHIIYRPFFKKGDQVYFVMVKPKILNIKGSDHKPFQVDISLIPLKFWLKTKMAQETEAKYYSYFAPLVSGLIK